ncbi:MFS transporter [Niveibacterium sp.]|uniref:MFS transporter n=1 Tax=Niveibacterium sp. TaxID=2017444 RepID=UPI0035B3A6EC
MHAKRSPTEIAESAAAPLARLFAVAALVVLFGLGMSAFLNYFKFQSAVESAARSRMAVPASAVREGVQASLALGLPLASAAAVPDLLARERQADAAIQAISIFDTAGRVRFSTDARAVGTTVPATWLAAAGDAREVWHLAAAGFAVQGLRLRNSFDVPQGSVAVSYTTADQQRALLRMRTALLWIALVGGAGVALLAMLAVWGVLRTSSARHGARARDDGTQGHAAPLQARLAGAILLVAVLGLGGVSWATQRAFDANLQPELARKAAVVARSVGELVGTAIHYGIQMPELVGVEAHLADVRRQHPELARLAIIDMHGVPRFAVGEHTPEAGVRVPIGDAAHPLGSVEVGVSAAYLRSILFEVLLDLAVVFVVAVFLTRELLQFITATDPRLGTARASGGAVIARMRVPLFLFMLAEELTRAFVPGFARALLGASVNVSTDVAVGVPITVFMLVVALGQAPLASWSERVGLRRAMQWGALIGVVGLAGAALAQGFHAFIAWRALCGLGYATVFVAAQGVVIAHTTQAERTRGFALFVGAIMVAAVCGPPLGGILADHVGARAGFAVAAAVALAAVLAVRLLPRDASGAVIASPRLSWRDVVRVLGERRFLHITVLAAVPAKLILASFCFYLVPIYVVSLGAPTAAAGRALMVYAAVLVLVLPWAAHLAERGVSQALLVGGGLCVSALGGFGLLLWSGIAPVFVAMALLGLGQGLSIAAQSSLLSLACAEEIREHGSAALFGAYRLIERLGNASGPLLAGLLVASFGHAGAFALIAALVLACGLLFLLLAGAMRGTQVVAVRA